ncbi:hypothetical protein DXG01_011357, partial [Tephrocybe rancida]
TVTEDIWTVEHLLSPPPGRQHVLGLGTTAPALDDLRLPTLKKTIKAKPSKAAAKSNKAAAKAKAVTAEQSEGDLPLSAANITPPSIPTTPPPPPPKTKKTGKATTKANATSILPSLQQSEAGESPGPSSKKSTAPSSKKRTAVPSKKKSTAASSKKKSEGEANYVHVPHGSINAHSQPPPNPRHSEAETYPMCVTGSHSVPPSAVTACNGEEHAQNQDKIISIPSAAAESLGEDPEHKGKLSEEDDGGLALSERDNSM